MNQASSDKNLLKVEKVEKACHPTRERERELARFRLEICKLKQLKNEHRPTCLVCMLKRTGDPQLLRRTEVYQAATIAGAMNARCISFSRVGNQEQSQI
jgi:aspartyl/asparaginyl beta-hydroxylase (cupin superfamily)